MFIFFDFISIYLFFLFILICLFLFLMVCSYNRVLAVMGGFLCLICFFIMLLLFDFSMFAIFFFLIYSSFFLVILLCVLMYVDDIMYFQVNWVIFFLCFIFCFLILDIILYSCGQFLYGCVDACHFYELKDLLYYFVLLDFVDVGLIGDLIYNQFPFLVIAVGFFLFLGFVCVPLLSYSTIKLQSNITKSYNRFVVKRRVK